MDGIQFNEPEYGQPRAAPAGTPSRIIALVLLSGVVKTERQAEYLLLCTAVIAIIVAVWLQIGGGKPKTPETLLPPDVRAGSVVAP
ncbi:MAG: hypothetical protein KGI41_03540 [Patescibacteria group bacterium]|nr:hypothetical protein [Patescibacteria group bacterium]